MIGLIMDKIQNAEQSVTGLHLEDAQRLNEESFSEEQEKLVHWTHWTEDAKESINQELKRLEDAIKDAKKAARASKTLEEKTIARCQVKKLKKRA